MKAARRLTENGKKSPCCLRISMVCPMISTGPSTVDASSRG